MTSHSHTFQFPAHLKQVRLRNSRALPTFAEPEVLEREQAAYERGCRDGERALADQLLAQRADLMTLEQGVLKSLTEAVPSLLHHCEVALAQLSLELANKLVAGMPISSDLVEAVVREALADLEKNLEYQVYLNPEDVEVLQRIESPLLTQKTPVLHFHSSLEVGRGGCMIKTPFGIIDARREVKLETLQKAVVS